MLREQASNSDNKIMAAEVSESGWTTYLINTSFYSESMVQNDDIGDGDIVAKCRLGEHHVALNEESNCVDGSTVSDASSGPQQPRINASHFCNEDGLDEQVLLRPKRFSCELPDYRKFKRIKHSQAHELEDTATSSPLAKHEDAHQRVGIYANCQPLAEVQQISSAASFDKCGSDDVSKRFKILEALIPCLKEVAGRASEEEMLKVIISYVQALQLKVEMFGKYCTRDIHDSLAAGHHHSLSVAAVPNPGYKLQEKGLCLIPLASLAKKIP